MTEKEVAAVKRAVPRARRARRKAKLKLRYKGAALDAKLSDAMEAVWLLCELVCERRNPPRRKA